MLTLKKIYSGYLRSIEWNSKSPVTSPYPIRTAALSNWEHSGFRRIRSGWLQDFTHPLPTLCMPERQNSPKSLHSSIAFPEGPDAKYLKLRESYFPYHNYVPYSAKADRKYVNE